MSGTLSNAFAATSPAQQSQTNASRSMTAGRSCIDSSTPSTAGRLMSCSDPMEFMRHIRVPHPFGAASGCANRQSCRFGIARLAALEVPLAPRARSVPLPPRPSHPIPRRVRPELHTPPPHRPQPCSSSRPRTPCASSPPMSWMQRLKRVFHIDIEHCGVCGGTLRVIACIETPLKCRSRSELARSSRGSSLISPPARPAPSTTPAHRRSVWAPRNPAPPITDHLLTAPTGAPRPRCASSTPCGPPPA